MGEGTSEEALPGGRISLSKFIAFSEAQKKKGSGGRNKAFENINLGD